MRPRRHLRLVDPLRPITRGDCEDGSRPCPWHTCRHHLGSGGVSPLLLALRTTESCSLDVAAQGKRKLREIGRMLGLSPERVRQIQQRAVQKLKRRVGPEWAFALASSPTEPETLDDIIDAEFKAGVQRGFERWVPKPEQGAKAKRVRKAAAL